MNICKQCTFYNHEALLTCEMCYTPLEAAVPDLSSKMRLEGPKGRLSAWAGQYGCCRWRELPSVHDAEQADSSTISVYPRSFLSGKARRIETTTTSLVVVVVTAAAVVVSGMVDVVLATVQSLRTVRLSAESSYRWTGTLVGEQFAPHDEYLESVFSMHSLHAAQRSWGSGRAGFVYQMVCQYPRAAIDLCSSTEAATSRCEWNSELD